VQVKLKTQHMKKFLNYLTFALFASLIIFASCGGGDESEPSELDIAAEELTTATATLVSVSNTSNGATELNWDDFTITFTGNSAGGTYTTTGVPAEGEDVWPTNGTWTFTEGSNGSSITRQDGTVIGITISDTDLEMSFSYDETIARVKDITGDWVFDMTF